MCGIAGFIGRNNNDVDCSILAAMTRVVAHRGPDDEGIFIDSRVGLGHRRLSILDLSPSGHQPMSRNDENLVITFNGEIYNYIELRQELMGLGQRFSTQTDTEVILAAYAVWGQECVSRFNGMWAFAIYDKQARIVFCSRDRFGVKPFYYFLSADRLLFGSEIRQLLPCVSIVKADIRVVTEFLLASITEPYQDTFFEGIKKLPGGHNLIYDLSTDSYQLSRYYTLGINTDVGGIDHEAASGRYGQQLSDAVHLRLRADVPVGTCLSGGLDSSTVATLAAASYQEQRGDAFCAITAQSQSEENDETKFARLIVDRSKLRWFTVKPTYEQFAAVLPEIVRAQEEPFGGPSIVMQFFVMKAARENGIPVLLDGQGGDETLLGYERYYSGHFLSLFRQKGMAHAFRAMADSWRNNALMSPLRILLYLVYFASVRARYWNYLYRSRYLRKIPPVPEDIRANAESVWNTTDLQKREIEKDCLPSLLRFEDKNSMWHSVETRLPFLDYRAVETAISLPSESKIYRGWTKYVLRKYMNDKMPREIAWRKNKFGFEAPERLWLATHQSSMRDAVLASRLLQGLSRVGSLEKLYSRLDMGTQWRLYSVALWENEFGVTA